MEAYVSSEIPAAANPKNWGQAYGGGGGGSTVQGETDYWDRQMRARMARNDVMAEASKIVAQMLADPGTFVETDALDAAVMSLSAKLLGYICHGCGARQPGDCICADLVANLFAVYSREGGPDNLADLFREVRAKVSEERSKESAGGRQAVPE
jgi:hypothetical protein